MYKTLLYFLLLNSALGYSQTTAPSSEPKSSFTPRVPPAPTAAALERYALMPVNESAGIPSISIPIYEVQSGGLSLPITLSYHASGIRVADVASSVGLGWSLNAGGVITRVLRGGADEGYGGFSRHPDQVPDAEKITSKANSNTLSEVIQNRLDYQPDLFTFNALGQSGSFLQGNDGKYHTLPLQPIRITKLAAGFHLVDAAGVQYVFTSEEQTRVDSKPVVIYASAWYLDRVISADKADTIRFEYDRYTVHSTSFHQQQTLITSVEGKPVDYPTESFTDTRTITNQATQRLRRIHFRAGIVEVNTAADRLDVTDEKRLVSVTVLSRNGQDTLKQIRCYHSYFTPVEAGSSVERRELTRLRLDSVITRASGKQLPPHRFSYNLQPLPSRLTGARDHWGYANGAESLMSPKQTPLLIPRIAYQSYNNVATYPGTNREPNPDFVQASVLTRITYPTGGVSQFVYEPNIVAKRYTIPNPRTTVEAVGSGPAAGNGTFRTTYERLHVTEPLAIIRYAIHASGNEAELHDKVSVTVRDSLTDKIVLELTSGFVDCGWSVAGTVDSLSNSTVYKIELRNSGSTNATFELSYESSIKRFAMRNEVTGGIRLREQRIQAAYQAPIAIKRYSYTTPGTKLSSGVLLGGDTPIYSSTQFSRVCGTLRDASTGENSCMLAPPAHILYTTLSSSPLIELSGSDRVIAYQYVTVTDSSNTGETAGKTVSSYSVTPDETGGVKPVCPTISNAWQRDKLLIQEVYATTTSGVEELVTRTENQYAISEESIEIRGFSAGYDTQISTDLDYAAADGLYPYIWANTRQTIGWLKLVKSNNYQYAQGNPAAFSRTTTAYRYDNASHQQPTLVEKTLQSGIRQQTRSRYAADYDTVGVQAGSTSGRAIREMLRNNNVTELIEQYSLRIVNADTLITQGALTLHQVLAPGVVAPARQLQYYTLAPRPLHQFQVSRIANGDLTYDGQYKPKMIVDHYDAQARMVQYHPERGQPTSILWGNFAEQPIAQVSNAAYAQVAYTSFEEGELGKWQATSSGALVTTEGFTGVASYQLNGGNLVYPSLPTATYLLSCWLKQNSGIPKVNGLVLTSTGVSRRGWTLYQRQLTLQAKGAVTLNGQGQLDELRLAPVDAQMVTMTYRPLVGITSQTGADNRTIFYEYDALGRLLRVRDEQGRILSQQEYKYAKQP